MTPAMIVAATIRADRYEPLQTAPQLAGLQQRGVRRTQTDAARPGSRRSSPARPGAPPHAGRRLSVEPALVDRLLAETAEGADALPLLALTLERLYGDYGDDGDLTVAEYESMGGMAEVVQTEVDELLAADPDAAAGPARQLLHDAFIPWLATINPDNDQPMRRLARWDDLPAASHPLIEALVDKRLLVKDTRDGQVVVEVALESLLRQWDELAGWLRDEAQDLKAADDLERTAAAWHASGRDPTWLLTGTRLADAETLAATPGFRDRLDPTRDFLAASRQRENESIEAEKQRQQAELQAAREKQEAAEALAAAERCRRTLSARRGAAQTLPHPAPCWPSPPSSPSSLSSVSSSRRGPTSSPDQSADRDRAEADRPSPGHAGRHPARRGRAGLPADPGRPHPHHPPTTARSTARWSNGPAPSRSSPATPAR